MRTVEDLPCTTNECPVMETATNPRTALYCARAAFHNFPEADCPYDAQTTHVRDTLLGQKAELEAELQGAQNA